MKQKLLHSILDDLKFYNKIIFENFKKINNSINFIISTNKLYKYDYNYMRLMEKHEIYNKMNAKINNKLIFVRDLLTNINKDLSDQTIKDLFDSVREFKTFLKEQNE